MKSAEETVEVQRLRRRQVFKLWVLLPRHLARRLRGRFRSRRGGGREDFSERLVRDGRQPRWSI